MGVHRFYSAECERSFTGAKFRDLKRLKLYRYVRCVCNVTLFES